MLTCETIMYPHVLMQGNPPSTTLTLLLWIDLPLHPHYQLPFLTFSIEQDETRADSMSALRYLSVTVD